MWLAPRDMCALMATAAARSAVQAQLARQLELEASSAEMLFAMATFHKFYERNYERCVRAAGEDADAHELVTVPDVVYRILRSLGFCVVVDDSGVERPLVDEVGRPVCALGADARTALALPLFSGGPQAARVQWYNTPLFWAGRRTNAFYKLQNLHPELKVLEEKMQSLRPTKTGAFTGQTRLGDYSAFRKAWNKLQEVIVETLSPSLSSLRHSGLNADQRKKVLGRLKAALSEVNMEMAQLSTARNETRRNPESGRDQAALRWKEDFSTFVAATYVPIVEVLIRAAEDPSTSDSHGVQPQTSVANASGLSLPLATRSLSKTSSTSSLGSATPGSPSLSRTSPSDSLNGGTPPPSPRLSIDNVSEASSAGGSTVGGSARLRSQSLESGSESPSGSLRRSGSVSAGNARRRSPSRDSFESLSPSSGGSNSPRLSRQSSFSSASDLDCEKHAEADCSQLSSCYWDISTRKCIEKNVRHDMGADCKKHAAKNACEQDVECNWDPAMQKCTDKYVYMGRDCQKHAAKYACEQDVECKWHASKQKCADRECSKHMKHDACRQDLDCVWRGSTSECADRGIEDVGVVLKFQPSRHLYMEPVDLKPEKSNELAPTDLTDDDADRIFSILADVASKATLGDGTADLSTGAICTVKVETGLTYVEVEHNGLTSDTKIMIQHRRHSHSTFLGNLRTEDLNALKAALKDLKGSIEIYVYNRRAYEEDRGGYLKRNRETMTIGLYRRRRG